MTKGREWKGGPEVEAEVGVRVEVGGRDFHYTLIKSGWNRPISFFKS